MEEYVQSNSGHEAACDEPRIPNRHNAEVVLAVDDPTPISIYQPFFIDCPSCGASLRVARSWCAECRHELRAEA